MTSPKEWDKKLSDTVQMCLENTHYNVSEEVQRVIKQIQLDAMKEGYKRAAEQARPIAMKLASDSSHIPIIANEISKDILTTSEQLTTKDL